jgi:chitin-binding protein
MTTIATAPAASAHGNVNDPIARGYRCLKLYGDIWYANEFKDSDPMCSNAFQTGATALWNWNGMLIDGLAGNYASVTDICSANNATYGVLSIPGPWIPTDKPPVFTLNLVDGAAHGADWIKVYVSKDGFDPNTQKLTWSDLVQVGETGKIPTTGNGIIDPAVGGSAYAVPVDATGYTGRRVMFTHWKASHADQTYYLCSDVNITGSGGSTTTTTTTTRPVTSTTTTTAPVTTTTTNPATTTTTTRPVTTTTRPVTTTTTRPVTTTTRPVTTTTRPVTTTTTTTTTTGNSGTVTTVPRPVTSTTSAPAGGCSATYSTVSSWSTGFQGEVKVTAGAAPISKWTLTWSLPTGLTITQGWSATITTSGSTVTATNMSYNGSVAAGASTSFGFLGSGSPSGYNPSITCSTA